MLSTEPALGEVEDAGESEDEGFRQEDCFGEVASPSAGKSK